MTREEFKAPLIRTYSKRPYYFRHDAECQRNDDPEQWPVFSLDSIGNVFLREFIDAACPHSEADAAAILLTFFTRLSAEVGRSPFMAIGDGQNHCNLLTIICGTTAGGLKGTSYKPVRRLFDICHPGYIGAASPDVSLSSGEGIVFAVRDASEKLNKKGEMVIEDEGISDNRLFVMTQELGGAFACMQRSGSTLSATIRQLYDTGNLRPLTKTSQIKATGAHIAICGHITPVELMTMLQTSDIYNGLINRFMLCCSRRQKVVPFPEPIPDGEMVIFQDEIIKIVQKAKIITQMTFHNSAKDLWLAEYGNLSEPQAGIIGAVTARSRDHVLRLAMLNALLDKVPIIDREHLESALAIWKYCQDSARYIFSDRQEADPLQTKIIETLKLKEMSATEIYKHFQNNISSEKIKAALKGIMEIGKIDCKVLQTNGRNKTLYFLKG